MTVLFKVNNFELTTVQFLGKPTQQLEDLVINEYADFMLTPPSTQFDKIKKYFIENTLNQFFNDLDSSVNNIENNISNYNFSITDDILDIIYKIFFPKNAENISDFELERLKNEAARNYYSYFLLITQKQNLNQRIKFTVDYLTKKSKSDDPFLYIGSSYGEVPKQTSKYNNEHYNYNVYVDLRKSQTELVNLAIVKLKIEEDFVSYKLNSLVAFLHDFGIITQEYYNKYIYGTNDDRLITLAKFGLSINLVLKLQKDNKISHLDFDNNGNLKVINKDLFYHYLENQPLLFQFEIKKKYIN